MPYNNRELPSRDKSSSRSRFATKPYTLYPTTVYYTLTAEKRRLHRRFLKPYVKPHPRDPIYKHRHTHTQTFLQLNGAPVSIMASDRDASGRSRAISSAVTAECVSRSARHPFCLFIRSRCAYYIRVQLWCVSVCVFKEKVRGNACGIMAIVRAAEAWEIFGAVCAYSGILIIRRSGFSPFSVF